MDSVVVSSQLAITKNTKSGGETDDKANKYFEKLQ